jgi:2-polyprenyl-6-methoxyphenol hydroxylase-like FAD-dependent oxidoreductase
MATGYDIVMVGGGLGGATLARVMAAAGKRVLVLERTASFQDRVRGEVLVPWGCTEARQLGLFDILRRSCGHELRWWDADLDGMPFLHRDLPATTRTRLPVLTFYHPDMQQLVMDAAVDAGAEVRRGAVATMVEPGPTPRVSYRHEGETAVTSARLVVGADGRGSALRKWGGFSVHSDPQRRFFAGVLMDDLPAPEDTLYSRFRPGEGLISWMFPQGGGRVRTYIGYHAASTHGRLQGVGDIPRFIETSVHIGVPEDYFASARVAGPLATFDGTDNWVNHPYQNGIALIGDAAATSDPTWGQGMALTLRDVRLLSEALQRDDDWDAAAHAYAGEHDRGYAACHTCDNWYTDLLLEIGPEADARRARAFEVIAQDPTRIPDTPFDGPEITPDDNMRRRMFGEDAEA